MNLVEAELGGFAFIGIGAESRLKDVSEALEIHNRILPEQSKLGLKNKKKHNRFCSSAIETRDDREIDRNPKTRSRSNERLRVGFRFECDIERGL